MVCFIGSKTERALASCRHFEMMAETQEKLDGYENEAGLHTPNPAVSLCVQCKEATNESQTLVSSCCGQHYCQVCVSSQLQDKRQCTSCGETNVNYMPGSLKHKIEQLLKEDDECTVKENGHFESVGSTPDPSHTEDTNSADSEVILEQCTNNCGQQVDKQTLATHLESDCPEREYVCPHCNLTATYNVIMGEHRLQCSCYPVACPNQCGVTCERSSVEDHLQICSSQETQCEFNTIGCMETFPRKRQETHMQENTQTHLVFMASTLATLQEFQHKQLDTFDQKLHQKHLETERRLKEQQEDFEASLHQQQDRFKRLLKRQQSDFEQKLKEEQDKRLQLETTLQAKERLIIENTIVLNQLQEQLNMVVLQSPPYRFTMTNFKQLKTDNRAWNSLPVYTQPGGYKVCVRVRPNGLPWSRGFKTHMSVWFFAVKGDYDESLVWPAEATITLQLLNQHHDKKHLTVTRRYLWRKDVVDTSNHTALGVILDKLISHEDLELKSQEEIQYLKDNCLRFRITDITVHS